MSVLFYRRPDYYNKPNGPISSSDCARYVERARKSERRIPSGLSFDDVINNRSLPPCGVDDFMDYLTYVEHNAENLHFYLWYNDYVLRFNALPSYQKALSPEWISKESSTPSMPTKRPERYYQSSSNREILATMKKHGYHLQESALFGGYSTQHLPIIRESNSSEAGSSITLTESDSGGQIGLKWQPCTRNPSHRYFTWADYFLIVTIQPMRDEMSRVMRRYLAFAAPRELNLSHKDRALCLHALQHTTHPSALLPAFTIATAALRGQSHPNFIRHSICNANAPRVLLIRLLGLLTTLTGFLLATLLVLSSYNRYYRFLPSIFWYLGITTLVAAYKGLCIVLHYGGNGRMRREWEWVEERGKGWWGEVFGGNVRVQDGSLRGLQERILLGASLWAGFGTVVLVVGVLCLPVVGWF